MRPNLTILAFDTSAAHCAAALLCNGKISRQIVEMAKGQAEHLMPILQSMLDSAGLGWKDLDAIGVGIGPGNFTGIRICVAAARGLALGLRIPAVGVSMLEAQAWGHTGPTLSVRDARRGNIYLQGFGLPENVGPMIAHLDALPTLPDIPQLKVVGDHAAALSLAHGWDRAEPKQHFIDALAQIAAHRASDPPARPAPLYLRPADAAPPKDAAPRILA